MPPTARERLEVWGDPIEHSQSPRLHSAAYAALGLAWAYGRRRVGGEAFAAELAGLDASFRGLSLTHPLKRHAFQAAATRDRAAELTGAANTLLLDAAGPHGFNTDIGGLVRDLRAHGVGQLADARIVGAGATAASALVALAELGAQRVEVVARRPDAAEHLRELGARLGLAVHAAPVPSEGELPLTVATLPGGASVSHPLADALAASGGLLYDVVYGHWPTSLASAWERTGGQAVDGRGMLVQQALLQVRVFLHGDAEHELSDENRVLAAMRSALA
ncbi:MAG: shikimate dehydrogenase [Microbacterium sp.]|uniref:shikimate dehydrogenase n=1 Tax=Microbacterium sp. TaxID=51671 RepID=UPI0039E6029A